MDTRIGYGALLAVTYSSSASWRSMETAIMVLVILVIAIGTVAYVSKVKAPQDKARRRAENKVKMSDPILRADIEILERSNSDLAGDAIALRRSLYPRLDRF